MIKKWQQFIIISDFAIKTKSVEDNMNETVVCRQNKFLDISADVFNTIDVWS